MCVCRVCRVDDVYACKVVTGIVIRSTNHNLFNWLFRFARMNNHRLNHTQCYLSTRAYEFRFHNSFGLEIFSARAHSELSRSARFWSQSRRIPMELIEVEFYQTDWWWIAKLLFLHEQTKWISSIGEIGGLKWSHSLRFSFCASTWKCLRRSENCDGLNAHCCHTAICGCIGRLGGKRSTEFLWNESNASDIHSGNSYDRFPFATTRNYYIEILVVYSRPWTQVNVRECEHVCTQPLINPYQSIDLSFIHSFQRNVTPFQLWKRIS